MAGEMLVSRASGHLATGKWLRILVGSAIALSWLVVNLPAWVWLGQALQESAQSNGFMLGLGGLVLLGLGWRHRHLWQFSLEPTLRLWPLGLMLGSALGAIALQWWIALDHVAVLLGLLGTYGLLGLYLHPAVWRRGMALALAIACLVPFGVQLGTGLGFPIRILTAHTVEHLLTTLNIAALSSEHIIVLENTLASVDLPCSGVKSLWTGTLFLLLATWLEGRQLGLRWLLVFGVNLSALVLANIGRVLTLVLLANTHQTTLAEMLHVPLGLIGFVTACVLSLWLLQSVPRQQSLALPEPQAQPRSRPAYLAQGALMLCLVGLACIPRPPALAVPPPDLAALPLPAAVRTEPLPLTPTEQAFFADYPGTVAHKVHFDTGTVSGSWLLVFAPTWRAHHAPEVCLLGNGYQVNQVEARPLSPTVTGRWLSLDGGRYAAAYWFQSAHQTTGDFLTRLWGEVTRREPAWVMVSVLFDQPYTGQEPEIQDLLDRLHATLDRPLQGAHS